MNKDLRNRTLACGAIVSTKPGYVLLGWGPRHWSYEGNAKPDVPCFYFPDFFLENKKPWFYHSEWREFSIEELAEIIPAAEKSDLKLVWQTPSLDAFRKIFGDIQQAISAKRLIKAVPYLFDKADHTFTYEQIHHLLANLLAKSLHKPLYIYGFWDDNEGIVGATPELLFRHHPSESLIETMACAGTAPSAKIEQSSFLLDPKECEEHRIVVEAIKESLMPYGKLEVRSLTTLQFPLLMHLVTPIFLKCRESFNFFNILKALHPTPALGAWPKEAGMKWLKEYEVSNPRLRFGAPVGYLHGDIAACYVAIRNIQWKGNEVTIGAGCGVIAQSQCEREYAEIDLKKRFIKEMLGL